MRDAPEAPDTHLKSAPLTAFLALGTAATIFSL